MCVPQICLGKRYRTFSGWGMAAGKVEVLLVVGGFDVDGGSEARLDSKDVNMDMQRANVECLGYKMEMTTK